MNQLSSITQPGFVTALEPFLKLFVDPADPPLDEPLPIVQLQSKHHKHCYQLGSLKVLHTCIRERPGKSFPYIK
jgi:hypothetical protein